jgi:hypothetical protein
MVPCIGALFGHSTGGIERRPSTPAGGYSRGEAAGGQRLSRPPLRRSHRRGREVAEAWRITPGDNLRTIGCRLGCPQPLRPDVLTVLGDEGSAGRSKAPTQRSDPTAGHTMPVVAYSCSSDWSCPVVSRARQAASSTHSIRPSPRSSAPPWNRPSGSLSQDRATAAFANGFSSPIPSPARSTRPVAQPTQWRSTGGGSAPSIRFFGRSEHQESPGRVPCRRRALKVHE